MKTIIAQQIIFSMAVLPIVLATGCKTVVRENIISSVNTGLGVTVAENPKTELYEVKVGYIRSQFYSVPTGKNVQDESTDKSNLSNAADVTPEIVSGIRIVSDARHLFWGTSIAENFAVGKVAVNSPAATAMYIATATNTNTANAAGQAAKGISEATSKAIFANDMKIGEIISYATDPENQEKLKADKVQELVKDTPLASYAEDIKKMSPQEFRKKLQRIWEPFVEKLHRNIPQK